MRRNKRSVSKTDRDAYTLAMGDTVQFKRNVRGWRNIKGKIGYVNDVGSHNNYSVSGFGAWFDRDELILLSRATEETYELATKRDEDETE